MLKIKSLALQNIGRFTERQTIQFAELGNLIQVDGQNLNTNGSSGSGKSTIFNSLEYLFGINDIPNTILQSRLTKEGISVQAVFDWDGKELIISRSKKEGLHIEIDGDITSGSSKLAEEKLDEILSISRKLFRPMLHKRQKEGGFFLELTPKEIHEFLSDCLALKELNQKVELLDNKIKQEVINHSSTQSALSSTQSALNATISAMEALGSVPELTVSKEDIVNLKIKADESLETVKALEFVHKNESTELDAIRPSVTVPVYDNSTQESLETQKTELSLKKTELAANEVKRLNEIKSYISSLKVELVQNTSRINSEISVLNKAVSDRDYAKTKALQVAEEIKKIRSAICPTCEQNWVTETAKTKEQELMSKIKEYKEKIDAGATALDDIKSKNEELEKIKTENFWKTEDLNKQLVSKLDVSDMNAQIEDIENRIKAQKIARDEFYSSHNAKNKQLSEEFASKQKEMATRHALELSTARGQHYLTQTALDNAVNQMRSYNEALERHTASQDKLKTQKDGYLARLTILNAEMAQITEELLLAEETKRAIKSYISRLFDSALEYIGDTATRIVRNIPNMSNATIQLEGLKETKTGAVKEEVNAVLHNDGEENIPIKSLSGGERTSLDLAIDLAVLDFLESRTGKGIDLFILDEPFNGLDSQNIEAVVEMLKMSNVNKRLIVVDHNPVIAETFEHKIVAKRDGNTSFIVY